MLLKREGYPEESELVWCKVLKVNPHSVFVRLEEYDKNGIINISEVSPGRIRNIRDYVQEGRFIVCKVLRVNKERGHIDLSLRRVGPNQKRLKSNEIKQEQKAEKCLEIISKRLKKPLEEIHNIVWNSIKKDYDYIHQFFEDIVEKNIKTGDYLPKKIAGVIETVVKERIKPKEVMLKEKVSVHCEEGNGLNIVKKAFLETLKKFNIDIIYSGSGSFIVKAKARDFKTCDRTLKSFNNALEKALKSKAEVNVSFMK